MDVQLRPINRANWQTALDLKVHPNQEKYVASNLYSLAQAYGESEWVCRGIYDGDTMVGFIMDGLSEEGDDFDGYWICRFMLAHEHQNKGYGRAAMNALLSDVRKQGHKTVFISFVPDNLAAKQLYTQVGFVDTGAMDDGEAVYRLDFNPDPEN